MTRRKNIGAAIIATAVAAVCVTGAVTPRAARADVKVVSELTLTGLEEFGARGIPIKITRSYKNGVLREEHEAVNYVHIYDSKTDKYYTLDTAHQTYSVQTLDDVMSRAVGPLARVDVVGDAKITEGGSTQTIAGKPAVNYSTINNLLLKDPRSGVGVLAVKITGEQWMATTLAIPESNKRLKQAAQLLPTRVHKVFKPYYDTSAEMKGLPLSFDLILAVQGAPGVVVPAAVDKLISGTFEAHNTVLSVKTNTLPESLFHVPKGYKLVPRIDEKDEDD